MFAKSTPNCAAFWKQFLAVTGSSWREASHEVRFSRTNTKLRNHRQSSMCVDRASWFLIFLILGLKSRFSNPSPSWLSHQARSWDVFHHLLLQNTSRGDKDRLMATVKQATAYLAKDLLLPLAWHWAPYNLYWNCTMILLFSGEFRNQESFDSFLTSNVLITTPSSFSSHNENTTLINWHCTVM